MLSALAVGFFLHPTPRWQEQVMDRIASGCLPVMVPFGTAPDGASLEVMGRQRLAAEKEAYLASATSLERDFEVHIRELPVGAIQEFNPDALYVGTITLESCLPGAE